MRMTRAIVLLLLFGSSTTAVAFVVETGISRSHNVARTSSMSRVHKITHQSQHGSHRGQRDPSPQPAQQPNRRFQIPSYLALDRAFRGAVQREKPPTYSSSSGIPNPFNALKDTKRRNFHHPETSNGTNQQSQQSGSTKRKSHVKSLLVLQNFQRKRHTKQQPASTTSLNLKRTSSSAARYSSNYTIPSLQQLLHTNSHHQSKKSREFNVPDHPDLKLQKRPLAYRGKERYLVQQFTKDLSLPHQDMVPIFRHNVPKKCPSHIRYWKESFRGVSWSSLAPTLPVVLCSALWTAAITSLVGLVQARIGTSARVLSLALNTVGGVASATRDVVSTALVVLLTLRIYFGIQQTMEKRQLWDKVLIQARSLASLLQVHLVRPVVQAAPAIPAPKVATSLSVAENNTEPQTMLNSLSNTTLAQGENATPAKHVKEEEFVGKNGRIGLVQEAIDTAYQRQANPDVAVALLAARYLAGLGWMMHVQSKGLSSEDCDGHLQKLLPESERAWILAQDDPLSSMLTAIRHCTTVALEYSHPYDGPDMRLSFMESRLAQLEDSVGTLGQNLITPMVPPNLSQFTSRMVATWVLLVPFTMISRFPVFHPLVITLSSLLSTAIVVGLDEVGLTLERKGANLFPRGGEIEAASLQNQIRNEFLSLGQMRPTPTRP